jgi:hypothetical protein
MPQIQRIFPPNRMDPKARIRSAEVLTPHVPKGDLAEYNIIILPYESQPNKPDYFGAIILHLVLSYALTSISTALPISITPIRPSL